MCSNRCAKPLRPKRLQPKSDLVVNADGDHRRRAVRRNNHAQPIAKCGVLHGNLPHIFLDLRFFSSVCHAASVTRAALSFHRSIFVSQERGSVLTHRFRANGAALDFRFDAAALLPICRNAVFREVGWEG